MMKKVFPLLMMALAMSLFGCGQEPASTASDTAATDTTPEAATTDAAAPEPTVIRWAQGMSGNVMVSIAKKMGYFDEEGVVVEEIPFEDQPFMGLASGQVDIVSNDGTNSPLQQIAVGEDVVIFGGHMLTGCMPIIAQKGTVWNGVEDLIGKKVAGSSDFFALTGPLLEAGHDPVNEVEWIQYPTLSDRVAAVVAGEVDYALIGTGIMYTIESMDEVDILTYVSDIKPNYSCCRMATSSAFLKENPAAIKSTIKALLRAQQYYEANKEDVVTLMAEQLGATKEYVAAYLLNEHYRVNADPIKNLVVDAWGVLDKTGFLDENARTINIEDKIDTALYKAALDEVVAEHGSEDPAFYQRMTEFFAANNL